MQLAPHSNGRMKRLCYSDSPGDITLDLPQDSVRGQEGDVAPVLHCLQRGFLSRGITEDGHSDESQRPVL